MAITKTWLRLPTFVRWILFLPVSVFVGAGFAWLLRVVWSRFVDFPIVVDLGFPVLCQTCILGCVFFTVPAGHMIFLWSLFSLRTLFSVGYIALGIWGLSAGHEFATNWTYWKGALGEAIVLLGTLCVVKELKDTLPDLLAEQRMYREKAQENKENTSGPD